MKIYFFGCFPQLKSFILIVPFVFFNAGIVNAEDSYFEEIQIDSTTKLDNNNSDLPTNPFEIVETIRRATA